MWPHVPALRRCDASFVPLSSRLFDLGVTWLVAGQRFRLWSLGHINEKAEQSWAKLAVCGLETKLRGRHKL